jgi:hypothetical protein
MSHYRDTVFLTADNVKFDGMTEDYLFIAGGAMSTFRGTVGQTLMSKTKIGPARCPSGDRKKTFTEPVGGPTLWNMASQCVREWAKLGQFLGNSAPDPWAP